MESQAVWRPSHWRVRHCTFVILPVWRVWTRFWTGFKLKPETGVRWLPWMLHWSSETKPAFGPRNAELNADFRRFHAGCHAANLGRPFAQKVISFSRRLEALGFGHGASMTPRQEGRFQIEVHPHAATVTLFGLDRIVKYKRGTREQKARELRRLRRLAISRLPTLDPALSLQL